MILALALPVMVALGGAAIDLHRQLTTRGHAQVALDAAALSASSSRQLDRTQLNVIATDYLDANLDATRFTAAPEVEIGLQDETRIQASLTGSVKTIFLGLIGITSLPVQVTSTAERGTVEQIELVLVLDNTWSMNLTDARGVRKIDALKAAARELVDTLMKQEDRSVRVGVVPYADYVNVGLSRRGSPWLDVPADSVTFTDRVVPAVKAECWTVIPNRCTRGAPKTCTRDGKDGVPEQYDCTPQTCVPEPTKAYQQCRAAAPARTVRDFRYTRWHGCVGSRREAGTRLHDNGAQRYPGIPTVRSNTDNTPNCLTEITPITDRKATVTSALSAMIINRGSYQPSTYIPSGAIWGINLLSPTAPMVEADAYSDDNRNPRKIMVLMTDGANTMKFNSNGTHSDALGGERAQANRDTAAICAYAKFRGIEIYTVALAVDSTTARDLLRGCATDEAHAFDARDSEGLTGAFRDIGASIYRVRLVR